MEVEISALALQQECHRFNPLLKSRRMWFGLIIHTKLTIDVNDVGVNVSVNFFISDPFLKPFFWSTFFLFFFFFNYSNQFIFSSTSPSSHTWIFPQTLTRLHSRAWCDLYVLDLFRRSLLHIRSVTQLITRSLLQLLSICIGLSPSLPPSLLPASSSPPSPRTNARVDFIHPWEICLTSPPPSTQISSLL